MIYKTVAQCFTKMQQNQTINDVIQICVNDFYQKIEFQFLTEEEDENKYSINRYERFKNFGKHLTLNTDNIIFEQCVGISQLKQECIAKSKILQMTCGQEDGIVNMFCNNNKIKKTISTNQFTDRQIQFCENLECIFGRGQFPCMTVHIMKINDIEYFYYTICR